MFPYQAQIPEQINLNRIAEVREMDDVYGKYVKDFRYIQVVFESISAKAKDSYVNFGGYNYYTEIGLPEICIAPLYIEDDGKGYSGYMTLDVHEIATLLFNTNTSEELVDLRFSLVQNQEVQDKLLKFLVDVINTIGNYEKISGLLFCKLGVSDFNRKCKEAKNNEHCITAKTHEYVDTYTAMRLAKSGVKVRCVTLDSNNETKTLVCDGDGFRFENEIGFLGTNELDYNASWLIEK